MSLGKSVSSDFKIVYSIFLNCVLVPPKGLISLNIRSSEPVVTLLFPDSHEHLDILLDSKLLEVRTTEPVFLA